MRLLILIIILHSCSLNIKAQNDTLHIVQAYNYFNNYEKAEWTSFMNDWNFFEYSNLLKSQNIKDINCKSCTGVYADIYLEIDSNGNVTKANIKHSKQCGETITNQLLREMYLTSILKRKFVLISNKKFIARFGHLLKC